jgi:hypothetical protein
MRLIISENYSADDLRDDIDEYNRMFTWMQNKLSNFVRTARFNLEEKGDRSLFVSNSQENLRVRDRQARQDLLAYYREIKLEGNIYEFWSPRDVKKIEQFEGQLNLAGELPSLGNYVYPYYCMHDSRSAGWTHTTDYKGIKQILYG